MEICILDSERTVLDKVATAASELGQEAFVVGGFVRDKILGRPTKDLDIVTTGDGISLAEKVAEKFSPRPKVSVFKTYGTAQLLGPDLELEFVGARKESYSKESRNPVVSAGTLEDDQLRRDFTINALAMRIDDGHFGEVIDPFNGIAHLDEKLITTPADPDTTFSDDPLRMLRAVRFAAQLGFRISGETSEAIKRNSSRIKIISRERIATEMNKILLSKTPSAGFKLLNELDLLKHFFPQLLKLHGAEIRDGQGHKDNFYHTLQVVDNLRPHTENLWLMWAALLHDIGKPATKAFDPAHGWTFHGHEVVGGRMVPQIFSQLKLPLNENMKYVRKLVELHLRPISLTKENITDSAVRRLLFDAGNDFDDLMLLCNADITSKNKMKVRHIRQNFETVKERCAAVEEKDKIRNWQPPISGELIMQVFGLSPSKNVGIIKDAIRNAILDGEVQGDYESAYGFMLRKGAELGLHPLATS